MKIKQWFFVGTALLILSGCQTMQSPFTSFQNPNTGPIYLSADEVHDLFANKTVESVSTGSGITSFTYYNPNGQLVQSRFWTERRGTWRVLASGEICLTMEGRDESCRMMALQPANIWAGTNDRYYKYKVSGEEPRKVVRYRQFIAGNKL